MCKRIWLLVLCAAILPAQGCLLFWVGTGAATGAATAMYLTGELKSTEPVALNTAWRATQAAVRGLELPVAGQRKDGLSATVTARGADNRPVTIKLQSKSAEETEIRIKVGAFGDEARSRQILDQIRSGY